MPNWLSPQLKIEIRRVFEPKYGYQLSESEVIEIADNLTSVMEAYLKMKWRQKYGNIHSRP
jgi:hypothetical protein